MGVTLLISQNTCRNNIKENLLYYTNIIAGAKTEDPFKILGIFVSENNLNWPKC